MKLLFILIISLSMFKATPVFAIEPLSAETLNDYCKKFPTTATSTSSVKCIAYIGGFLDGAVATDKRVAENVVAELETKETLTQRAFRTRVSQRLQDKGASVYAEFCISDPVPVTEVIMHVIDELNSRPTLKGDLARTVVYDSVRKHYPCDT